MDNSKRQWLGHVAAAGAGSFMATPPAHATTPALDGAKHKVVYQINKADPEYIEHILNSISAMLGKYVDDVQIAIVAFGPGIHLLATHPGRPMPDILRQRVRGLADNYGAELVACGNTMKTIGWSAKDIIPQARIEEVGAAALMEMQERGWAYIAW
ncbi:MAG: hypothetical protein RLZ63_1000 [Pseudomonadota bacterium]|jgi:intracellular sulfur oxidation DsrE/DsrF family protein